ncbi:tryptophan synthase subunit alpha [Bacillus xiapuensis]|uniref:tryptophan synthase subunit alpha n=1 Tax=Bacillus xiapuensis TaxID=2014075 RepID=UPI000C240787|nr:tryptophan synthase subunit alpha [Bacillus xiapuensis]
MSKKKIETVFQTLERTGKKAFVPYIMAGDGGMESLKEQLLYLQEIGVTMAEVGIPFSDPVADGPVIQEAGKRALANGVTLHQVLNELNKMQAELVMPLILMTYYNPVFQYGLEKFASDCQKAGVSAVIIPDLPIEEEEEISAPMEKNDLALIHLVTLTSTEERMEKIMQAAKGFIYAVTVKGITGARNGFSNDVPAFLRKMKEKSPVPVLAGFGVSTKEQAEVLSQSCDGVIVGSKIVDLFHKGQKESIQSLIPDTAQLH